jgi:hypothetical protein
MEIFSFFLTCEENQLLTIKDDGIILIFQPWLVKSKLKNNNNHTVYDGNIFILFIDNRVYICELYHHFKLCVHGWLHAFIVHLFIKRNGMNKWTINLVDNNKSATMRHNPFNHNFFSYVRLKANDQTFDHLV